MPFIFYLIWTELKVVTSRKQFSSRQRVDSIASLSPFKKRSRKIKQRLGLPSFPREPEPTQVLWLFPTSFPLINTYTHWKLSQLPIVTLHMLYFKYVSYYGLIFFSLLWVGVDYNFHVPNIKWLIKIEWVISTWRNW